MQVTIKRNYEQKPRKNREQFPEKAELKVINGKLNNTEQVCDLEDRIMEISNQSCKKKEFKRLHDLYYKSPRKRRTKRERGQKCVYLIKLWQKPFQT